MTNEPIVIGSKWVTKVIEPEVTYCWLSNRVVDNFSTTSLAGHRFGRGVLCDFESIGPLERGAIEVSVENQARRSNMAERKVVLLETDDLMHPNSGESNFNESAYYNFYDRKNRVGGFVRMGNRPNEGNAEMTVCIYLPDNSVGFMFKRPEISNNDAHSAGGLKFEVVKPFEHHRVSYQGKLCMLKNPLEMAEPTVAFKNNPYAACELRLDYYGTAPGWGGELREKTEHGWGSLKPSGDATQQFAKGHLEQVGHAAGTLKID